MLFAVEAMRPDGTLVADRINAGSQAEAADVLREKGLMVMRIDACAGKAPRPVAASRGGDARVSTRDLILFTRQMTMLLEAGTPMVPALEAAAQQTARPHMKAMLIDLRERVEQGDTLTKALDHYRRVFDPVFRSMVAAGEATATLPDVFSRLCTLTQRHQQTKKMLYGALLYPALLSVMLVGVCCVLLLFVVPRFRTLFESLKRPMPASTVLLFNIANGVKTGWPYIVGALVLAIVAVLIVLRQPALRARLDELILRLPGIGSLATKLCLARVVRIWAAMLRCHVPLLDTVQQSREVVTNAAFLRMLNEIEESVSSGGRMGQAIAKTGLADPVIVSAIRTGEDNGRLADAAVFVSDWIDDDNSRLVQQVTRLAEPLLLALMGVVVGFVAMGLFLPLFDMATAG